MTRCIIAMLGGSCLLLAAAHRAPAPTALGPTFNPDVIVAQVGLDPGDSFGSFVNYGVVDGWRAYAVNTTSCNVGTDPASWRDGTIAAPDNRHPVIATNMYRFADGRFEQVGLGWVKHSFCALDQSFCDTCQVNFDCDWLGVGCSDPYNAGTNGNQSRLGPRYEINPSTGDFPAVEDQSAPIADATSRRLRVLDSDVQPEMNPGARYFIEGQYITADDIAAGNGLNNVSWREVTIDDDDADGNEPGELENMLGTTTQEQPAIMAWPTLDPNATVTIVDVPGDGRLYVGWSVAANADGSYTYEYAVYNMTADRAVGGFHVPLASNISFCDAEFRDVTYDAGEPWDGTDWDFTAPIDQLIWTTVEDHATDPNANAIRWGTLYNFSVTTIAPPVAADLQLDLFKPGTPTSVTVAALAPGTPCPADCAPPGGNGQINIDDLLSVIDAFGNPGGPCDIAPVNACSVGNETVNIDDLLDVIDQFGPCP